MTSWPLSDIPPDDYHLVDGEEIVSYKNHAFALDYVEEIKEEGSRMSLLNRQNLNSLDSKARETHEGPFIWKDAQAAQDVTLIEGTITVSF